MAIEVLSGVPSLITKGDAISFKVSESDYPAPTWTSIIVFRDSAGAVLPFNGTASGSSHLFALTSAHTATLVVGKNTVTIAFNDGTNRQTVSYCEVEVLPDPAAAATPTFAQTQVTKWQTICNGLKSRRDVNINGQSFSNFPLSDAKDQLTYWRAEVIREQKRANSLRGCHHPGVITPAFSGCASNCR